MMSSSHSVELPHEAYLTALASLDRVGPATIRWLLSNGTPRSVWALVRSGRLAPGPGIRVTAEMVDRWARQSQSISPEGIWVRCVERGFGVLSLGAAGYPHALAEDTEPPVLLFQAGDPRRLSATRVAIVGTRRASGYGRQVARSLARELTMHGVTVVSGLALGIDVAAHSGALEAIEDLGGGTESPPCGPLAVVGSSLDSPCPRPNLNVAKRVVANGLIYSEVPPGTPSAPWRFPVRNRILAALSDIVVVVESDSNGGSMHTVREALDRNRVVMAVPGPINCRSSAGTNALLRDGAAPCLGVEDILDELGLDRQVVVPTDPARELRPRRAAKCADSTQTENLPFEPLGPVKHGEADPLGKPTRRSEDAHRLPTGVAGEVVDLLGWRPTSTETIASECDLSPRELARVLASLESQGWVRVTGSWVERMSR
ncbi:MAG: DNA-processing protein DprA [Microthrixaceae bacterium]